MALCFATFDSDGILKSVQECGDTPPEIRQQLMEDNVKANGCASCEELKPETAKMRVLELVKTNPRMSEKSGLEVVENFIARHEQEQKKIADEAKAKLEAEKQRQAAEAHALIADIEELYGPDAVDEKLAEIESNAKKAKAIMAEIEDHRNNKKELEEQQRLEIQDEQAKKSEKAERVMRLLKNHGLIESDIN